MSILRPLPSLSGLKRKVFAHSQSLPAGSLTSPHSHSWGQLSYAIKGVLEVRTKIGNLVAPPQVAVYVPPSFEHQVFSSQRTEMRALYLRTDACQDLGGRCKVLEVTPLARELILAASKLAPDYDESGREGRLVAVLLDELAALPELGLSLPLPQDERLSKVCNSMFQDPEDNRGLEEWAELAGMSGRNLLRLFSRETGLSFGQWRKSMRLLAALGKLEEGKNVTAVALECGYGSTSMFIADFKARFGVTPGKFFESRS